MRRLSVIRRPQLTHSALLQLGLMLVVPWLVIACASNPTTSNAPGTPRTSTARLSTASATSTGGAGMSPLVVGSTDHSLYALDAATGTILWTFQTGDKVSAQPITAHGVVYAGSEDHAVYAVSANTGTLLWKKGVGWYPALSSVVAGSLYVGTANAVLALRTTDGSMVWSYSSLFSAGTPVVADGVVYVDGVVTGGDGDTLVALNAADGSVRWRHVFGDYTQVGAGYTPVLSDGMLFITDSAGVYALDPATGAVRWHVTLLAVAPGLSPLTVQSGAVYVSGGNSASDFHLFALRETDGARLREVKTDGFAGRPLIAGGTIYLTEFLHPDMSGDDMFAYALSAANGSTRWHVPLGAAVNLVTDPMGFAVPLVEGDIVVVGSDDANLYGIGVADGATRWRTSVNGLMTTPTPLLTSL